MVTESIILSAILFSIGALGVMLRRNLIMILLSVEIMLNAANLSFVAFSAMNQNLDGQVMALFVIAVAASEVAIGLALSVLIFKNQRTRVTRNCIHRNNTKPAHTKGETFIALNGFLCICKKRNGCQRNRE